MDTALESLLDNAAEAAPGHQAPREALDREEQLIRDSVLRMGSLVEEAIRQAARALVGHDAALALDVVKGDAVINEAQRGVSRLIAVTIATQQPVARDLR
ncbi:MAG: PhoU domain-containing protein, partial [Chloroflexota bacterium]